MDRQHGPAMSITEWSLLMALGVIWGGSFFFAKVALAELPPLTVVLGRVGFAAIALNLIVFAVGQRMPSDRGIWAAFFAMGALNNLIPFTLIVWGQSHIASGLASILNATTPLFTIVVAHFLTQDEQITSKKIVGVVLGLLGVAVTIGPDAFAGLSDNVLAQVACLGGALSYAFAGIYGRRFKAMGVTPLATATGQVTATTMMMLPLVLLVDRPWTLTGVPGLATWGAILGIALVCTALAYILYFRLLASVGATNLLLVTFLIPLSAILLGAIILGERLAARHFAGVALIGFGLATIDGRLFAAISTRTAGPLHAARAMITKRHALPSRKVQDHRQEDLL